MSAEITFTEVSLLEWMQGLAAQGGLTVEGDESENELAEAITHLAETNARRAS